VKLCNDAKPTVRFTVALDCVVAGAFEATTGYTPDDWLTPADTA